MRLYLSALFQRIGQYLAQYLAIAPQWLSAMLQQPALRQPIAIGLGAIAGALARYYLSLWFRDRLGSGFPFGTLFVNLTGCFGMGLLVTLVMERAVPIPADLRLLLAVGFLGSYTTFSTYGLESLTLLRDRQPNLALAYWLGSAVLGVLSVQLGSWLARAIGRSG